MANMQERFQIDRFILNTECETSLQQKGVRENGKAQKEDNDNGCQQFQQGGWGKL